MTQTTFDKVPLCAHLLRSHKVRRFLGIWILFKVAFNIRFETKNLKSKASLQAHA